ncbi:hypothetical protein [Methanoculleus chikugoensis]|uniref:hypothetical protein n=1 Tax=Methanoculleus chikugoensis TaxID=118126 RepID=UPI001FB36DCB|nr:hypothetical protein [Methanoculleus chikugoensis]
MLASYGQLKKAVFFGLDTNLFYHGFASNNPPRIEHASYLIVDTVRDEIAYAINRKYPAKTIGGEMTALAPDCREYIVELENKRTKRSRKAAYLALKEYRTIVTGRRRLQPRARIRTSPRRTIITSSGRSGSSKKSGTPSRFS